MKSLTHFWEIQDAKKKKTKENQKERYRSLNATPEIIRIIDIGGGSGMGTMMESYARYTFSPHLTPRVSTGHDHICMEKKLEQKSSGLWDKAEDSFKWQHIEVGHNWEGLLLAGIYPTRIRFWGLTRANFVKLIGEGKVTNQGNKEKDSSEGMWMLYKDIKDSLVEIETPDQLVAFSRSC